jgi:ribosomal protein L7/L12
MDPSLQSEVSLLLREGRKIEAVKRVREATGLGLKESNELVERWEVPQPAPARLGEAPKPADMGSAMGEARALLQEGKKIEAVKRVREATGLGLKESKELVERWEVPPEPAPARLGEAPKPVDMGSAMREARALLQEGKKIEAIKRVREATGLGLKEAKELVERWEATPEPRGGLEKAFTQRETPIPAAEPPPRPWWKFWG